MGRRSRDQIFENQSATRTRRCPVGFGGQRKKAALPKQSSARRGLDRNAPEVGSVNVWNAVVLREPLVDERVIRFQYVENISILADDALEEHFGLPLKCLPQIVVKVGESEQVGIPVLQLAQEQPLTCEIADHRIR